MAVELPYNEKELLARVAKGDEKAFEKLMHVNHIGVYHAVHRLSGDRLMAEEVVQDFFLKVWLKRTSLPDIVNFGAWLNTVAENIALNAIKQSVRKKNDVKSWVADFYKELHHRDSEENYLGDILKEAVLRLPARQREAYTLLKEQGYQRDEAAAKMNVSPETVKSHIEQALRNIRAYCMASINQSLILIISSLTATIFFDTLPHIY